MPNFLVLKNICKSFMQGQLEVPVLKEIDFCFDFDKNYAITGVSGSGKSTLMHIMAGVDAPNSGEVSWNNEFNINQLTQVQKELFWNQKVGLIFQQANLISELTVLENVALKGLVNKDDDAYDKAFNLLQDLGLKSRLHFFPDVLSRGEQQRVSIARALMCGPKLILADEPTASLDQANGEGVVEMLIKLTSNNNVCLIISTHDQYVYDKMDRILTISNCKLNLLEN